jgi:uncharacterized protein with HXXEE motif
MQAVAEWFAALSLRQAVWLFPVATGLHFLEEAPRFADWAKQYTLSTYDRARWARIHGTGMAYAIAFAGAVSLFPNRTTVFLFFALCFSENVWNSLFHFGATLAFRVYCPGLFTAIILYPPLYWLMTQNAKRDGFLTSQSILAAFLIAGLLHATDVATTVFGIKLWRPTKSFRLR